MGRSLKGYKVSFFLLFVGFDAASCLSWMHFKTVHQNNSWMSTINKNGFGDMITEDFVKLMENNGFRVDDAKTVPLKYKFETDFIRNYFKSVVITSFPELQGDTRKKFFNEFIPRVKDLTQLVFIFVSFIFGLTIIFQGF